MSEVEWPPSGRTCSQCKTWKPRSDFYPCPSAPDGMRYSCKECCRVYITRYRARDRVRCRLRNASNPRKRKEQIPYILNGTREELIWFAGLFDGEGCIRIVGAPPSEKQKRTQTGFSLELKVNMTHKETIDKVIQIVGFGTYCTREAPSPKHRPIYGWVVRCRQAEAVLEAIKPFLVTKKAEAEIAERFSKIPKHMAAFRPEFQKAKVDLYWEMRSFKGIKGTAETSATKGLLNDRSPEEVVADNCAKRTFEVQGPRKRYSHSK